MTSDEVKNKLGNPNSIVANSVRPTWEYYDIDLSIHIDNDRVVQIIMKNNGKWFLDKSKLNYRNTISDFCQAYNLKGVPVPLTYEQRKMGYSGFGYRIADGEYLWFDRYPDTLTLSIYNN